MATVIRTKRRDNNLLISKIPPDASRSARDGRCSSDRRGCVDRHRRREWLPRNERVQAADHLRHHAFDHDHDGFITNFRKFLVEGTKPNLTKIKEYVDRSLMLVTALSPVIGYDKASKNAHYAYDNDLTLKEAALKLAYVDESEFDKIVDPK
jgi:hypothetical protein